jgi:hypothetical protein
MYTFTLSLATVVVNEVAENGAGSDVCSGEAYIELKNIETSSFNPPYGFLVNNKQPREGLEDIAPQYGFPYGSASIDTGDFRLLCRSDFNFAFAFNSLDTVTLYDPFGFVDDTPQLHGRGSTSATYQRLGDGSGYRYALPTANAENVF